MGNFAENLNLGNRFRPPWPNPKIKACLTQIQAKMSPGECPFKSHHFDGGIIIQVLIS